MFPVTTVNAAKYLSLTGQRIDAAARRARLRAVGGVDLRQLPAFPRELVGEKFSEQAPTLIEDASCKSSVGFDHVADLKILDHDGAMALGVVVTELMTEVLPLPPDLSMQVGDTKLCFLSVLGSFLSSRDGTLGAGEPLESLAVEARRRNDLSIGVSDHVRDASVNGNHGIDLGCGIRDLDLAPDRHEPLIAVPLEGAALGSAFEGPVNHGPKVAKLGEADRRSIEAPGFGMGLGQAEEVTSSLLPPRSPCDLLEASLPRLVEFNEKLSADVAGDIGEPWQLFAKLGQFVDLVEGRGEDTLIPWTAIAHLPLFKGEIPEPAERALPFSVSLDLDGGRVDAVAERLARDHGTTIAQPTTTAEIR